MPIEETGLRSTGLITFDKHLLCAVDLETTGLLAGYHEIVQICVLPLDENIEPRQDISPFYMNVKPFYPERASAMAMKVNGLSLNDLQGAPSSAQVIDCLHEWFEELNLPLNRRIVPLTQNAPFDIAFLKCWMGNEDYDSVFLRRGRDTMFAAAYLNDQAAYQNKTIPFTTVGLKNLCEKFGIDISGHHDALADCIATAKVYRELLRFEQ